MYTVNSTMSFLLNAFKTKTENNQLAYTTTQDKCLDFYLLVTRDAPDETIFKYFGDAYQENKLNALRILCDFRDIRNGKGERRITIMCLLYLKICDRRVYTRLLYLFVNDLGYWKDLCVLCHASRILLLPYKYEIKLIVTHLEDDLQMYNRCQKTQKTPKLSLIAKWLPSEKTKYHFLIREIIRESSILHSYKDYRQALTKLRAEYNLLETNLCNHTEENIRFSILPAKCHMKHKNALLRETNRKKVCDAKRKELSQRYKEYIESLKKKKTTIKITGLQPHEIIQKIYKEDDNNCGSDDFDAVEILEAQWATLVERTREGGSLDRTMAVVDVSGSMYGTPINVSVALGLLISQCCSSPNYKNKLITFDTKPTFHHINPDKPLSETVRDIFALPWGGTTNLKKVFELILQSAIVSCISADQMVKTLFILTDMQFDQAAGMDGKVGFLKNMEALYQKHGYEMPIVFVWNLRTSDTGSVPEMKSTYNKCFYLSGFSKEILIQVMSNFDTLVNGSTHFMVSILENIVYAKYQQKVFEQIECVSNYDPSLITKYKFESLREKLYDSQPNPEKRKPKQKEK
jgi:hypothetical protein